MEEKKLSCSCNEIVAKVVLSCSGQSDLGELSDVVARKIRNEGIRTMKCLAQVAIDNKALIESIKSSNLLVIDGCPVDCARKISENAGFTGFHHFRLTDHGFVKNNTPVNEQNINAACEIAKTYV